TSPQVSRTGARSSRATARRSCPPWCGAPCSPSRCWPSLRSAGCGGACRCTPSAPRCSRSCSGRASSTSIGCSRPTEMRPSSTSAALAALACAVVVLASACTEDPDAVTAPPSTTAVTASTTAPTSASTSTSPSTSTSTTTTEPPTPRALVAATWPAESDDTGPDLDADPSVRIAELAPGDCVLLDELVEAGDGQVESVEVVECAVPHDAEIYAVVSLDDDPDSDHPGDEVVVGAADQVCLDAFDPYVGAP